jgi:hypothetical protein
VRWRKDSLGNYISASAKHFEKLELNQEFVRLPVRTGVAYPILTCVHLPVNEARETGWHGFIESLSKIHALFGISKIERVSCSNMRSI